MQIKKGFHQAKPEKALFSDGGGAENRIPQYKASTCENVNLSVNHLARLRGHMFGTTPDMPRLRSSALGLTYRL